MRTSRMEVIIICYCHDLRETMTYLVALHTVWVLKMRYYNAIFKALPDHQPNSQ